MDDEENLPAQCHPPKPKFRNIGPTSQKWLNEIGVFTLKDLEKIGPEKAFELIQKANFHPSKNLLYALIGAVQDEDWKIIADTLKKKKGKNAKAEPF